MPTAQVFTIIASCCAIVMALISVAGIVWYAGIKHAALEVKVDALWEYHLDMAQAAALRHGSAKSNSPISATPEAKAWLLHRGKGLRAIYRPRRGTITDSELYALIFQECGRELFFDAFIPKDVLPEVRLFVAMQVAKDLAASDTQHIDEVKGNA